MLGELKPYRGPSFRYRIRRIVSKNKTGDSYGITIPKSVATMFSDVTFNIFVAGNNIILASGCRLEKTTSKKIINYENNIFE